MEIDEKNMMERLQAAMARMEEALRNFEQQREAMAGEVGRISATVEQSKREMELAEKLTAAEQELAQLRASVALEAPGPLRRTVPTATAEMLAKHGIGEGPVEVRTLDAALAGLSLEQRIAVKSQLMRAGAIA
jgi:multidrug resistance efflux pump